MAVELNDFVKWLWTVPVTILWGSFEKRLGGKVSKGECKALHTGLQTEVKNLRGYINERFEAQEKILNLKTDLIIGEIKKVNGP